MDKSLTKPELEELLLALREYPLNVGGEYWGIGSLRTERTHYAVCLLRANQDLCKFG